MKKYLLLILILISLSGYSQNTINNYKNVIVPEKFAFQKSDNQYGLNDLAKMMIESKGFTAYFDGSDLPAEIASQRCSALNLDITEKSGMFSTGLTVLLKDCQGNVLFKSKEGKSREKDFRTAFSVALGEAFKSLEDFNYAYAGPPSNLQNQQSAVPAAAATTAVIAKPVPVVNNVTAEQNPAKPVAVVTKQAEGTLYAQPTANGYNLIDTAPKIVLTLYRTSQQDYFIANNGTSNGIVLKKNADWVFEYYKQDQLISEKLVIKF